MTTPIQDENEKTPEWMKPGYWENRPWQERLEEYGDLHGENCSCMMEDPDECDCDEMRQIKGFVQELIDRHQKEMGEWKERNQNLRDADFELRKQVQDLETSFERLKMFHQQTVGELVKENIGLKKNLTLYQAINSKPPSQVELETIIADQRALIEAKDRALNAFMVVRDMCRSTQRDFPFTEAFVNEVIEALTPPVKSDEK